MEPVSLLLAGATYVAVAVARKAGDDLVDETWRRIRSAVKRVIGRDPEPAEVTPELVRAAVEQEPALEQALGRLWQDAGVLRRARAVERALAGARILWVDDRPEGNVLERQCLAALRVHVTTVETTRSALACLEREAFDLIVSDIARGDSPTEGLDALPRLAGGASGAPVVYYVMHLQPRGAPPGAFGITNRPDELLHLCMDALERRRW